VEKPAKGSVSVVVVAIVVRFFVFLSNSIETWRRDLDVSGVEVMVAIVWTYRQAKLTGNL